MQLQFCLLMDASKNPLLLAIRQKWDSNKGRKLFGLGKTKGKRVEWQEMAKKLKMFLWLPDVVSQLWEFYRAVCEVHTFRVAKWKFLQCLIIFLKTLNFDRVMVKCIPHQDILFEAMFFTDFHSNCSVHKQAMTSRIFIHNVHTKSLLHVIRGRPAITKLLCKRYLQLLMLKAWLTTIFVHKMLYVKITNCILGFTIKNRDSAHKLTNCQDVGGDAN